MHTTTRPLLALALSALALSACATQGAHVAAPAPMTTAPAMHERPRSPVSEAKQIVVVTTPAWDSTSGTLRRFERAEVSAPWREVGAPVAIVVGQTGLAWDDALPMPAPGVPVKREGDGRSPAGAFALDTAFGFSDAAAASWIALPYLPLRETTECVDDVSSTHYNTIVDRAAVPTVDWTSAEHMRRIGQYRLGVHVAYNAPPRRGRGSCIFMHIWAGPSSVTSGCTAMDAVALEAIVRWLDPARRPMLVQLPEAELQRLSEAWRLP